MQFDCPQCAKPVPWDGKINTPVQILKCPFCGHRFSSDHAPSASFSPVSEKQEELWELGIDEDPIPSSSSLLDDFEMMEESANAADGATQPHFVRPSAEDLLGITSGMQVPDLPDLPLPVSNIIKMGGSNWDNSLDEVDSNIPLLPPLDFELKEASAEDLTPKQSDTVSAPKRPKAAPRPAPSVPPEAPPIFASKPPPGTVHAETKPSTLSDLLESFVEEETVEEETRYYLQRNDKEFGPFTEQEIMQLLESRKLKGEELVRYADSNVWKPLEQTPDFQPTIEVLRKVPVRVGWERHAPTSTSSIPSSSPLDVPVSSDFGSAQMPPSPPSTQDLFSQSPQDLPRSSKSSANHSKSQRRFVLPLAGGGLLLLAVVVWFVFSRPTPPPPKSSPGISTHRLSLSDSFPEYKKLLQPIFDSYRRGDFSLSWYRIRFAYALLDSFGEDRTIRTSADPIYLALQKQKKADLLIKKIALLRAISLRDHKQIEALLSALQKKLPLSDPEWGYVFARALELTGKYESAQLLYDKLLRQHPQHIRARLGQYRVLTALQKPYQASSHLLQAFRNAPTHLPSQLTAMTYALTQGTWLTFRPQIRKNLESIVQKGHHTQGGLARWYALQAQELWLLRQTDQAIYRLDQAIALAPHIREHRWTRIQYYLWSKKPHIAQQSIRNEPKHQTEPQLIIWNFMALLQYGTQQHTVKFLEPISQKAASLPTFQYLYYYLLALSYLQQQDSSSAITSCLGAIRVKNPQMPRPYAHLLLLRIYAQERDWKKIPPLLDELGQIGYSSATSEYYQGLALIHDKKWPEASKLAEQIQQRYPTQHQGYLLSATLAKEQKDLPKTLRFYRKALLHHPERPSTILVDMGDVLLAHQKPQQAYELFARYEKLLGEEAPCSLLQRKVQALFMSQECQKLLAVSVQSCKNFQLHLYRGKCAEQLKQPEQAMLEYQEARRLVPNTIDPIEAIANLHFQQNQFNEAKALYTQLQQKDPRNPTFLARLLQLLRREQLYSQALALLEEHGEPFAQDFELQRERVSLLLAANKIRDTQKLLNQLQKSFTSSPQTMALLYVQAALYDKKRNAKQAIKTYTDILAKDNKQIEAYLERGKLHLKLRSYAACNKDLQKVLELAPNHPYLKTIELWRDSCQQKRQP